MRHPPAHADKDHDAENDPVDPRLVWQRKLQLRRAKAQIWLAAEDVGMHAAVVILNDALREALDRLEV